MNNLFAEFLLDKDSPLLNKDQLRDNSITVKNEFEQYIINCSRSAASLSAAIEKSKLSISLLDIDHINSPFDDCHQKHKYLELIVENCIIRIQTIYDRVLYFVNVILDIGNSHESINHQLLVSNTKVKHHGMDVILKKIYKSCDKYRFIRNAVIHHDRYSEEIHDEVIMLNAAAELSREVNGTQFITEENLSDINQNYLKAKQEEFKEYLEQIELEIQKLIKATLKVYNDTKNKMRPTSPP